MKRLVFFFVVFCLSVSVLSFNYNSENALATNTSLINQTEYTENQNWFLNEYKTMMFDDAGIVRFYDRTAGTEQERDFALYLEQRLIDIGLIPVGTDNDNPSFEYFEFTSSIDGYVHRSQNIHFVKKGKDSTKKIIICTAYDNAYGFAEGQNSLEIIGEDASTNNILALICLANYLSKTNLEFDVEFILFGAGYHNMAGSDFYIKGIDEQEKESILVAINLDDFSEDNFYYYDSEKSTSYGNYAKNSLTDLGFSIDKYKAGSSVIFEENKLYPFSHRALFSDNINLLQRGIRTISLLTVDKNGYFGNEYYSKVQATQFNASVYPEFLNDVADLSLAVGQMICLNDFTSQMVGTGEISSFWTDARWCVFISLIVFILICILYFMIYNFYFKKLKDKYSADEVMGELGKIIDKEIDKSNNPNLSQNRTEIKDWVEKDLKDKINKDKDETK